MITKYRAIIGLLALSLAAPAEARQTRSGAVLRQFQLENPCPSTGSTRGSCPGWIKDHRWPLCAGGADSLWNLQWQTVEQAKEKDRHEAFVCAVLRHHR